MGLRKWRPVLLKVHRWLGLTAGLLLMLNAFTGSLMLGARPLDRVLNAQLFEVKPAGQPVPLETIRQALVAEYGGKARFTIRPPREPEESVLVYVTSDSWQGQAHYDPYSGRKLGAREEHEGFANALFEFHSALLAGDTGKTVLAFNTVTMLAMLVTGVLLWWPARSWRGAFSVNFKGGLLRSLFDLHRVGGVVLGGWVLVCVLTGTWMAWRPVSQWVTQAAGQKQVLPPAVKAVAPQRHVATADDMIATANAAMPGGVVGYLGLPAKPTTPVRIRKKLDDDPHPNGLSSVWLHPVTGEVIRVDRWSDLDIGTRSYAWIYPLHSGKLAGVIGVIATAAGGFLLFGFGVSGTWLWWLRRRMRAG
ncbi:PepSY-associated TM helix domain-containing protein [Polaromonas sp. YR568]|uniref:PepSY-associated TM helix domain-containing protein n=1 Tax=Polaromonas sp. YR568 TaxID=1855301 RepID=UPI00398BF18D